MNAIVVVDKNWTIGREGGLLVHLSGDLKYFKEKTLGKTIVVGRKTLESFPDSKPLPGRNNIVVTGNQEFCNDSCTVCYSFQELMEMISKIPQEDVFISGGQSVYQQFLPYVDSVYVTKIREAYDGDRYFENLDESEEFELTEESQVFEEKGIRYNFNKYERVKK